MNICSICGSLRKESWNRAVMNTLPSIAPSGMKFKEAPPYDKIPNYVQDDQKANGFPDSVKAWAAAIREADGVVIVTPEYNFSLPGVLKNAIDWVSRMDAKEQPFLGKPCAILTASGGPVGGSRVQYETRKVLQSIEAMVLPKPEVFVTLAPTKIDAAKAIVTDATTLDVMTKQMAAFEAFIKRLS